MKENIRFKIKEIRADQTRPLRQIVLRPNQKAEDLVYPGDDSIDCYHAGVFIDEQLVSIATVYPEAKKDEPSENAWRLRGMATLPEFQGKGLGQLLLENCMEHIRSKGGKTLWCNARIKALEFYRRLGFRTIGDTFDIPDIGLHYVMERDL
jgi:ribosomal protein S18 acetylase RimI-like enzyme